MSALTNLGVSAGINAAICFLFFMVYKFFSKNPGNKTVYFGSKEQTITKLNDLDSILLLRTIKFGIFTFIPITILNCAVLLPIYYKGDNGSADLERFSLSNVTDDSFGVYTVWGLQYITTTWLLYSLWIEAKRVVSIRSLHIKNKISNVVLLKDWLPTSGKIKEYIDAYCYSIYGSNYYSNNVVIHNERLDELVEKYKENKTKFDRLSLEHEQNPEKVLMHQTKCLGFMGPKVDSLAFYKETLENIKKDIDKEIIETETEVQEQQQEQDSTQKQKQKQKGIQRQNINSAFVFFTNTKTALIASQMKHVSNFKQWIISLAPEPNDIFWNNLNFPSTLIFKRQVLIFILVWLLVIFFMIPVTFVQSLTNLETLKSIGTPIKQLVEIQFINSLISGFLPGLALLIFMAILPMIMNAMSTAEGRFTYSSIERGSAKKLFYFYIVNILLGSSVAGTIISSNSSISISTLANAIPTQSTFFMTYIMIDGWSSLTGELARIVPLIVYHLKKKYLTKTPKEKEDLELSSVGSISYITLLPKMYLYFCIGLVYAPLAPILLLFMTSFLCLAFQIYKHQIANVYSPKYQSYGQYWLMLPSRLITGMILSQLVLIAVTSSKSTYSFVLAPLPIITSFYYILFRREFRPLFYEYPLSISSEIDVVNYSKLSEYTHPSYKFAQEIQPLLA